MKRLLTLGWILLLQNPVFSQRLQCPSGTAPLGTYTKRDYIMAGWKGDKNGYKCQIRRYDQKCGDLIMNVGAKPSDGTIGVRSKQNVSVGFHRKHNDDLPPYMRGDELTSNIREWYNQSTQEVYRQISTTGYFESEGVSKLLQMTSVREIIQKCGRPSF